MNLFLLLVLLVPEGMLTLGQLLASLVIICRQQNRWRTRPELNQPAVLGNWSLV